MRRCPICKNALPASEAERRWAPFCSERCKLIDLGNWLGEAYRIPQEAPGDAEIDERSEMNGESSS